jgi:serine/threonine protein phosphatase PrpC
VQNRPYVFVYYYITQRNRYLRFFFLCVLFIPAIDCLDRKVTLGLAGQKGYALLGTRHSQLRVDNSQMQDRLVVRQSKLGNYVISVLADGHGGTTAPRFFSRTLADGLERLLKDRCWNFSDCRQAKLFQARVLQLYQHLDEVYLEKKKLEFETFTAMKEYIDNNNHCFKKTLKPTRKHNKLAESTFPPGLGEKLPFNNSVVVDTNSLDSEYNELYDNYKNELEEPNKASKITRRLKVLAKAENQLSNSAPPDDGCTLLATVIYKGWIVCCNVGDSRALIFSRSPSSFSWSLIFSTEDHSLGNPKVAMNLKSFHVLT